MFNIHNVLTNLYFQTTEGLNQPPLPPPAIVAFQAGPNRFKVGPNPCQVQCPNCRNHIFTSTHSNPGLLAWAIAGGLCMFG